MITMDALQTLKDTDIPAYKKEIAMEWDTQKADLERLYTIIDEFKGRDQDGKIPFSTALQGSEEGVDVHFPGWLISSLEMFIELYGVDMGQVILEKCLHHIWEQMVPAQPLQIKV